MSNENADLHASLIAAHKTRLKALLDGDAETLATVVGEDLTFVSSVGQTLKRPEVFAAMKAGTMKIERMDDFDIDTRIYGGIGVLIYRADTKAIHGDDVLEGTTRSTTVYAKRGDGWQLVSQHQSLMTK
jgi:ketosteroid isomerase-like protein